tara:strand:+ start:2096 stop:2197 length:102 start_codon:yes stop_codon:yes gene_type:complete
MTVDVIPTNWIEMAALLVIAGSVFVMAFYRKRK